MESAVIITGDKKLDRALRSLPAKLQKKGVRKATRESAKTVLADAKRGIAHESGRLEKSLTVRTAKGRGGKRLARGTIGHAVATREGLFQGDAFYGGFIEFGTKPRQTKKGESRGRVEEDSFLRRALYGNQRLVNWVFKRNLGAALRQIANEAR